MTNKKFSKKLIALILIFSIFTPSFVEANREMRLFAGFKIKLLGTKLKLLVAAPEVGGGGGCSATDTGWLPAGTGSDNASIGTVTWTAPNNIIGDDNGLKATASGGASTVSHYLRASNFGISLPSGSTINGLEVRFQAHRTVSTFLSSISIFNDSGATAGTAKTPSVDLTAVSDTVHQYGGSGDLWGLTPTEAQVEDSDWGYGFSITGTPNLTGTSDFAEIKIYFTPATCGSALAMVSTNGGFDGFNCAPDIILRGNITSIGDASVTTRGFATCTVSNCGVIGTSTTTENGTFGTGTYTDTWTGRSEGVTYYYRAYAINSFGTGYGVISSSVPVGC